MSIVVAARQLRVFLSYQMEDSAYRNGFVRDVACREPIVRFLDYPVADLFDTNWKEQCAELIRRSDGTVVLVGCTTSRSAPVAWEIAETGRQGLPLMGIQLFDEGIAEAPIGLEPAMLIPRPDVASVILRLRTWGVPTDSRG
jgi:hypothetical protein